MKITIYFSGGGLWPNTWFSNPTNTFLWNSLTFQTDTSYRLQATVSNQGVMLDVRTYMTFCPPLCFNLVNRYLKTPGWYGFVSFNKLLHTNWIQLIHKSEFVDMTDQYVRASNGFIVSYGVDNTNSFNNGEKIILILTNHPHPPYFYQWFILSTGLPGYNYLSNYLSA